MFKLIKFVYRISFVSGGGGDEEGDGSEGRGGARNEMTPEQRAADGVALLHEEGPKEKRFSR